MEYPQTPAISQIIEEGGKIEPEFEKVVNDIGYDSSGIFNSELLFFITCVELLDVEEIIESGRHKGHSTQILAEYFSDENIGITSIEKYEDTNAEHIARKKLKEYDINLINGDSTNILPERVGSSTAVIIDGPKGDSALDLTINLFRDSEVPLVAVHDLYKNRFHRDISEIVFHNHLFTDNKKYIDAFEHLDKYCWKNENIGWDKPYHLRGKKVESYSPTLGLFFNSGNPINSQSAQNYQEYRSQLQNKIPEETPISTTQFIGNRLRAAKKNGGSIKRPLSDLLYNTGRKFLR